MYDQQEWPNTASKKLDITAIEYRFPKFVPYGFGCWRDLYHCADAWSEENEHGECFLLAVIYRPEFDEFSAQRIRATSRAFAFIHCQIRVCHFRLTNIVSIKDSDE